MEKFIVKDELQKDVDNSERIWTVYVHIVPKDVRSSPDKDDYYDKYYVGITSQSVERRWRKNGVGYNNQKAMRNAINKYGWDNIQHEIIAEHLTHDEAGKLEKVLIKELGSHGKYGYNGSDGDDDIGKFIDISGKKFGHLTVMMQDKSRGGDYWICECDCEEHNVVSRHKYTLTSGGETLSCDKCTAIHRNGIRRDKSKYGDKEAQIYNKWRFIKKVASPGSMHYNPNLYIDQDWLNDFLLFQSWCYENGFRKGKHLIRLDTTKGYYPENCVWINKEDKKEYNIKYKCNEYEYNGILMSAKELAQELKIPYTIFEKRLSSMSFEKAISLPYKPVKKRKE